MPGESENIFITGSQIPSTNEKTIQSILEIIKNANTFQDAINTLEADKLIWYFLRHLLKDHEILDLINPKWEREFADFNKSIDSTAKKLKGSIENQEFLVYPKPDNSLEMRFIGDDPKQISVETSSVLRASPEGKTINISLGIDSTISTIRKKGDEGDERHYYFSNSDSCKMIINWQVKGDQGKLISCSMTLIVGPNGIEEVIDAPLMELVEQNNEVFINGKPLYQALMSMAQSVNNQQETGETILPAGVKEPDGNKYGNDDFENEVKVEENDHEELKQENKQLKEYIAGLEQENKQLREHIAGLEQKNKQLEKYNLELEHENKQLKKDRERLKERNEQIVAEGDGYRLQLAKSEEQVKLLESELAKKKDELRKMHEESEAKVIELQAIVIELKYGTEKLEKDLKNRDDTIRKLENEITRLTGEINRINKVNEELQRKPDESEQEKKRLKTENEELKKVNQTLTSALNGQGTELAESQSTSQQLKEESQRQLKDLKVENERLVDDLEQEKKKNQQSNANGKSLLDEMSGGGKDKEINELKKQVKEKGREIQELEVMLRSVKKQNELAQKDEIQRNKLTKQVKEKNREILKISEELEKAKKEIESKEGQSKQKIQELSKELQIAQEELEEFRDELNQNDELISQLRDGTVSKKLFAKLQSERDKLKHDSTVKEKQLVAINTKLKQTQEGAESIKKNLEVLEDQLRQQEEQKAITDGYVEIQTNVEQREVETGTALPEDNQDTQTTMVQKNQIIKKLEQENSDLIEDKQTILKKLDQEVEENSDLKQRLKNLQEENEQLKQKPAKKETRDGGGQTEGKFSRNVFDDKGKYVRTEFKGMPPPETDLSETHVNAYNTNKQKKDPSPGP